MQQRIVLSQIEIKPTATVICIISILTIQIMPIYLTTLLTSNAPHLTYAIYHYPLIYRVTHHIDSNLMLTTKQKFRFGLARAGQAKTELLF